MSALVKTSRIKIWSRRKTKTKQTDRDIRMTDRHPAKSREPMASHTRGVRRPSPRQGRSRSMVVCRGTLQADAESRACGLTLPQALSRQCHSVAARPLQVPRIGAARIFGREAWSEKIGPRRETWTDIEHGPPHKKESQMLRSLYCLKRNYRA